MLFARVLAQATLLCVQPRCLRTLATLESSLVRSLAVSLALDSEPVTKALGPIVPASRLRGGAWPGNQLP